jgi:hypothetical protein
MRIFVALAFLLSAAPADAGCFLFFCSPVHHRAHHRPHRVHHRPPARTRTRTIIITRNKTVVVHERAPLPPIETVK